MKSIPKIICHVVSSGDGRLITDYYSNPFDGKDKDDVINPYSLSARTFSPLSSLGI